MKNNIKRIKENSSGEVTIESMMILLLTVFVLIAMISLGFLIYQQAMISTVAAETATAIARDYKYTSHSRGLNESTVISDEAVSDASKFRSSFAIFNMKSVNGQRADDYIRERIPLTSFTDNDSLKVENIDIKADNIGRLHTEVIISMDEEILFFGSLKYFNFSDENSKLTATARAESLDITAYAGHVNFVKYMSVKSGDSNISSIAANIYNSVCDIKEIVKTLFS